MIAKVVAAGAKRQAETPVEKPAAPAKRLGKAAEKPADPFFERTRKRHKPTRKQVISSWQQVYTLCLEMHRQRAYTKLQMLIKACKEVIILKEHGAEGASCAQQDVREGTAFRRGKAVLVG